MSDALLVMHQTRLEQRSFWRNPDSACFTFALPIVLLVVLGAVQAGKTLPGTEVATNTRLVPGVLAFGVIVAAYANLAARMSVLRNDGALKRVRTTPMSPVVYLGGQLVSTLLVTLLIAAITILIGALGFHAAPRAGSIGALVPALLLGITCFASLGLAISAVIRSADAASPVTNATYLPLAIVSGVFDPTFHLPGWLSAIVAIFPIKAFAETLDFAYMPTSNGYPAQALVVLGAWTIVGVGLAIRCFRWQPSVS
jgi:ABC-2 type transport system permease protein